MYVSRAFSVSIGVLVWCDLFYICVIQIYQTMTCLLIIKVDGGGRGRGKGTGVQYKHIVVFSDEVY